MNKIKAMFKYFNLHNLQKEVGGYGYDLKLGNFIATLIAVPLITAAIGYTLELKIPYIIAIILVFFACIPSLVILKFKYMYEQQRFSEINSYLEQMIYSFKKKAKILTSLEDVRELANNNMARVLDKAIKHIEDGMSDANIYEEAFSFIEKEYSCSRLKTLHTYLIEIEENGGEYQHSLSILLEDIQQWAKRIRLQQQTRKGLQGKVFLSIILAMVTCSSMLFMVPQDYVNMIVSANLYQIFTTVILISCILLYVYANNKLTSSYLEDDNDLISKEEFDRYYKIATKYNVKEARKKNIIKSIIVALLIPVAYIFNQRMAILPIVLVAGFFIIQPNMKKNNATKKVVREIEKTFPIWIRNLILHLQSNNVPVALYNSIITCPAALRFEIARLVNGIQQKPGEIEPYLNFMKEFDGCHDIKSSMKHLYALSEFGADDLVNQLDYLVEQNQELIEHAEEMQNEDKMAGLSTLILAPMLLAIGKLVVDLWLLSSSFMGYMGSF